MSPVFEITAHSTKTARWRSEKGLLARSSRNSCGSAATGIRAAAFRSTCSGRPANCRRACGFPIRAWHPIAGGADKTPHPEERPLGRVSKDEKCGLSWFETREDALLTMRTLYRSRLHV